MKRENIMAMADSYMNRYTEGYPFTKDTIFAAFVEGASRMNYEHAKAWHPISDKPDEYTQIVYVYNLLGIRRAGYSRIEKINLSEWRKIVKIRHIEKWAYFNELIEY